MFRPACDAMRATLATMVADYLHQFTVNEMCARARLCR
jgi:hypothetical protein